MLLRLESDVLKREHSKEWSMAVFQWTLASQIDYLQLLQDEVEEVDVEDVEEVDGEEGAVGADATQKAKDSKKRKSEAKDKKDSAAGGDWELPSIFRTLRGLDRGWGVAGKSPCHPFSMLPCAKRRW